MFITMPTKISGKLMIIEAAANDKLLLIHLLKARKAVCRQAKVKAQAIKVKER